MNKSIFRRLLLSYMFTLVIGLGAIGFIISFMAKGYIYDAKQDELLRKAKKVNLTIQDTQTIDEDTAQLLPFLDQVFDARIWVFDRNGKILATSTEDEVNVGKSVATSIVDKVLKGEDAVSGLRFEGIKKPMLSVVVPWGKDDKLYGGIVLHSQVEGASETIGGIRETILWVTLAGMLFSITVVSYISWSISRPLQKINKAAAEISLGNYSQRIHINSTDEIDDLAATINKMAEALEKVNQERKKLDQVKDDFLANVSHELRTPLTAMQGFLEALQDGLIPEEGRQKYYDVMYKETLHMNRLVADLFDLIKLENETMSLSNHPIDVVPVLQRVALKFRQAALEKGIEIIVGPSEVNSKADADQDRLEQIVSNLVNNAVKFTDQGRVVLLAEEEDDFIVLEVSDTGRGISEADQELIWERFFKADKGRSKKNSGTGLGLAIVKRLVELHGGKVSVESRVGIGTTFRVEIPKHKETAAEQEIAVGQGH
ncbi:sensor histidine kinase [Paenibacillus thermotolerans]|uniref:sensor histidine kinase n=1 Tax=Paenibacillus thermotolerans TaxID=3027807 RepID=UPI002367C89E|nr:MULTISPECIES: HAMP domain-containing sensor histidine kinase [unclassified Paenibacillus]